MPTIVTDESASEVAELTTLVAESNSTDVSTVDEELVESNKTDSITTVKPVKVTTHTLKKSAKKANKEIKESKKSKKLVATSTETPENSEETVDFDDSNVEDEELLPPMNAPRGRGYSYGGPRKFPLLNRRNYWARGNSGNWRSNDQRNENDRLASFRSGPNPDRAPAKNPGDSIIGNPSDECKTALECVLNHLDPQKFCCDDNNNNPATTIGPDGPGRDETNKPPGQNDPSTTSSGDGSNTSPNGGQNTSPNGGQNTTPNGQNTSPNGGQNTTPNGQNTSPNGGQNTSPNGGQNTTPNGSGQNTSPNGGQNTTPNNQNTTPNNQNTTPNNQNTTPNNQNTTPNNQNTTPSPAPLTRCSCTCDDGGRIEITKEQFDGLKGSATYRSGYMHDNFHSYPWSPYGAMAFAPQQMGYMMPPRPQPAPYQMVMPYGK